MAEAFDIKLDKVFEIVYNQLPKECEKIVNMLLKLRDIVSINNLKTFLEVGPGEYKDLGKSLGSALACVSATNATDYEDEAQRKTDIRCAMNNIKDVVKLLDENCFTFFIVISNIKYL